MSKSLLVYMFPSQAEVNNFRTYKANFYRKSAKKIAKKDE